MSFLELAAPDARSHGGDGRSQRLPLAAFKNAEPLGLANPVPHEDDARAYYGEKSDSDPAGWLTRFDVSLLAGASSPGQRFILRRWRTLSSDEKRGRIHPWTPYAVRSLAAAVMEDGRYSSAHTDWGWVGGRWTRVRAQGTDWVGDNSGVALANWDAAVRPAAGPEDEPPDFTLLGMAHQHAVYRALLWHVAIGYAAHQASLLVPCAAHTILDLFRNRELAPGKARRDALLHWVETHGRRTPSNADEVRAVAAHLRGRTRFVWRDGLVVSILPSEEDKKRVKEWHKHAADPVAPR